MSIMELFLAKQSCGLYTMTRKALIVILFGQGLFGIASTIQTVKFFILRLKKCLVCINAAVFPITRITQLIPQRLQAQMAQVQLLFIMPITNLWLVKQLAYRV